jgi:peptide/nickel transport system substrate-binding protein
VQRRSWLSVVMLAIGAALLVAAGYASPADGSSSEAAAGKSELRRGGTLRINIPGGDIDHIDPALAYGTSSWAIEYSTALKLLNYPDAPAPRGNRLVPEGASKYTVSNNGRTYTFTIRRGHRFSNGRPVTANNYAYAINRALDRDLQSPAFQFVSDPSGSNIVGAQAVRDGRAAKASGVRVSGNRLIVRLTKADPTFLAKISMPFFQAASTSLPRGREVINVDGNQLPSAGPYYVSHREPNRVIIVQRNRFYRGTRPRNPDTMNFRVGVNLEAGYREVVAGQVDYQEAIPPTEYADLARRYGVNRGQFRVAPSNCTSYIGLNNSSSLFRNNIRLRKAVNYAINRNAMVQLSGAFGGQAHDQILPPGFPGFRNANLYPSRPNIARARSLARGATRSGNGIYFYSLTPPNPQRMELVRANLRAIGIDIEPRGFRGFAIYDAAGSRTSDHAFVTAGWCQDYPDPYDFVNVLLYGGNIQEANNNNLAYFNNRAYNQKMLRAAKLLGQARMRTYGNLDIDIMRNQAPWAVWNNPTNRFFYGRRIAPRSWVYQPIYENPVYNALSLR